MLDILAFQKICLYCNLSYDYCICPSTGQKNKLISQISEKEIKRKKWVTLLIGYIDKQDFKILKDKLGTGGTHQPDRVELRGRVSDRAKKLLTLMGYYLC